MHKISQENQISSFAYVTGQTDQIGLFTALCGGHKGGQRSKLGFGPSSWTGWFHNKPSVMPKSPQISSQRAYEISFMIVRTEVARVGVVTSRLVWGPQQGSRIQVQAWYMKISCMAFQKAKNKVLGPTM